MESDSDLDLPDLGSDPESGNSDDESNEDDELPDLTDVILNTTAPTVLSNSNDGGSDSESSDNDLPDLGGVAPIVLSSSDEDGSDAESSDNDLPDLGGVAPIVLSSSDEDGSARESSDNDLPDLGGAAPIMLSSSNDDQSEMERSDEELHDLGGDVLNPTTPTMLSNSNDDLVGLRERNASSPTDIFMDDYSPPSTNTAPPMVNRDPQPPDSAYELVTAANEADFARQVMRIVPPDYFDTADDPCYPLDDTKQEGVSRWRTVVFTDPTGVPLATVPQTKTGTRFWDERLPLLNPSALSLPQQERSLILRTTIRKTMAKFDRVPLAWL
jgi:hypothetical protein